jgi:hypothetical protein
MSVSANMSSGDTSFVLTSCGRFDLLERTIGSFLRYNTYPIGQFVLVEDSGQAAVLDVLRKFPAAFEVIVNERPRGQVASIDLAYERVTRPWIFHCEDDWEFLRPGLLDDSRRILEAHPNVSVVNATERGILSELDEVTDRCSVTEHGGVRFRRIPEDAHPLWFGYSFNPGLRRLVDWQRVGPFAAIGHEPELSLHFRRLGMSMAVLEERACTHIGGTRHVADPVAPIEKSDAFLDYYRKHVLEARSTQLTVLTTPDEHAS